MVAFKVILMLLVMTLSFDTSAYDVLITVTGTVKSSSCEVSLSSQNIDIFLGNYATNIFSNVGDTSPAIPFYITLDECTADVATNVRLTFSGDANLKNSELLALDNNADLGVGIRFLNENHEKIVINSDSAKYSLSGSNAYSLLFYAQYESVSDNFSPGAANATATFTLQYE